MLNYEIYDNQKEYWVVFIHGMGGSTLTWKRQIDAFSEKYNLLLLDLQGHGKSSSNDKVTVQSVNDGIKEVLDFLHIKKADFVGMSLGTMVIAQFAIKYPAYVNSLVFGGAAIQVDGIYKLAMNLANGIKHILPTQAVYRLFASILIPAKWHKKSRSIFLRESKHLKRKNFLSWIKYVSVATQSKKLLARLKALNIKMLFVSGDHDFCFIQSVKKISKYIGNSKLKILKACGHVCTIEKYKEFNASALNFLHNIHTPMAILA